MTLELARVAAEMAARRAWTVFGYENPHDFARELLDRSGRWLRDLGDLGEALERLPALEAHLLGCNGTPPLGRVAALHVAQVATPESLPAWVALARRSSVRELVRAVRTAQALGSSEPVDSVETTPPATAEATPSECDAASPQPQPPEVIEMRAADLLQPAEEDTEVRLRMPRAAAAAFEEGIELHRMVIGRSSGTSAFLEALVGEAASAGVVPDEESKTPEGLTTTRIEAWTFALPGLEKARPAGGTLQAALAEDCGIDMTKATLLSPAAGSEELEGQGTGAPGASAQGTGAPGTEAPGTETQDAETPESLADAVRALWQRNIEKLDPSALEWAHDLLDRVERRTPAQLRGGARRLGWRLGGLLVLEGELERCIAHLLSLYPARLGPGRARGSLGAAAEELLGVSRRTVERRVALRQVLVWLPRLRHAYEAGDLGMEASWRVWRVLGRGPVDAQLERDWLAHAVWLSVRRLQDEVLLCERRRHGLVEFDGDDYRRPPTDEEWFASLRTVPGATRSRIATLAARARMSQDDNVFLTLRLSGEQAQDFVGTIAAACRLVPPEGATEGPETSDTTPHEAPQHPATRPARAWEGLLMLLMEFAAVWDDPKITPRRDNEKIHRRHAYRCMAPGCTARAELQVHHIHFRSHQGPDTDFNLIPLCPFHHNEGPHGRFMRCAGRAPLDLTFELGRADVAATYRNDRWIDTESQREVAQPSI